MQDSKATATPATLVKIYGERHTGTNVTERLIGKWPGVQLLPKGHYYPMAKETTRDLATYLGTRLSKQSRAIICECLQDDWTIADGPLGAWKHSAARFSSEFQSSGTKVLFLVKSPGAWIVSFYRRPYHRLTEVPNSETIADFVNAPWISVQREKVPQIVPSPILLWNLKVRSYFAFKAVAEVSGVECKFIRFEDLVLHQEDTAMDIAEWMGLPQVNIRKRKESIRGEERTLEAIQEYYHEEQWRSEINDDAQRTIVRLVEPDLLDEFEYQL